MEERAFSFLRVVSPYMYGDRNVGTVNCSSRVPCILVFWRKSFLYRREREIQSVSLSVTIKNNDLLPSLSRVIVKPDTKSERVGTSASVLVIDLYHLLE